MHNGSDFSKKWPNFYKVGILKSSSLIYFLKNIWRTRKFIWFIACVLNPWKNFGSRWSKMGYFLVEKWTIWELYAIIFMYLFDFVGKLLKLKILKISILGLLWIDKWKGLKVREHFFSKTSNLCLKVKKEITRCEKK